MANDRHAQPSEGAEEASGTLTQRIYLSYVGDWLKVNGEAIYISWTNV